MRERRNHANEERDRGKKKGWKEQGRPRGRGGETERNPKDTALGTMETKENQIERHKEGERGKTKLGVEEREREVVRRCSSQRSLLDRTQDHPLLPNPQPNPPSPPTHSVH